MNDIEFFLRIEKKCNTINDYGDEREDLQSKLKKNTKFHELNGWEILVSKEILLNVNDPSINVLFTDIKKVESYDLQ